MTPTKASHPRLSALVIVLAMALACATLSAQPVPARPRLPGTSIVKDWTTHHVVYSNPGSRDDAVRRGSLDQWQRIVNDPRYQMWQADRYLMATAPLRAVPSPALPEDADDDTPEAANAAYTGPVPLGLVKALIPPPASVPELPDKKKHHRRLKTDWQETEGSNGTTGLGEFPATYTASATSLSCTGDFAVFNTGITSSSSQASILAIDNLYTTCNGGTPTVNWAYNTSGAAVTSPILSRDGTQVAFIQANSTGQAQLVLLRWKASNGTLAVPVTPTAETSSAYYNAGTGCTAPCSFTLTLSGTPSDTYSSPFYDYTNDVIYVGDDSGSLHKFNPVFNGAPAEVTTTFPVSVNANASLGSPVYDAGSTKVFVGDYAIGFASACQPSASTSTSPCGFLYSVGSSSGTVTKTAQLDYNYGVIDSPLVDPVAGEVYPFAGADNSTACGSPASQPCAAVYQLAVGFSSGAAGTKAQVGAGYQFLMSGAFDNAYFTSNGSSPTGHMYVVGNTGPANNTLYQLSINSNVLSATTVAGPAVSNNYTDGYYASGLQVSEFLNGSTDYIFLSVLAYGVPAGCTSASLTNGCVMGFNVTSGTISGATAVTGASPASGGSSGIIVDSGQSGASNVYFSTLLNQTCTTSGGTGGCAIQISQAAP